MRPLSFSRRKRARFRRRLLQETLTLMMAFSTLIILVVMLISRAVIASAMNDELMARSYKTADEITVLLQEPMFNVDDQLAVRFAEILLNTKSISGIRLDSTSSGTLLIQNFPGKHSSIPPIMREIYWKSFHVGTVSLAFSSEQIEQTQAFYWQVAIALIVAFVFTNLLVNRFILRKKIEEPFEKLEIGINSITRGRYDDSIPPTPYEDVNRFVTLVNQMAVEVRNTNERLLSSNRLLEAKVDELRATEKALDESRLFLSSMMDSTDDMIWSVNAVDYGLLSFNQSFREHFEKEGIEVRVGLTPGDLLPRKSASNLERYYAQTLKQNALVLEDQSHWGGVTLLMNFHVLFRDGQPLAISVFGKDISSRKEMETEILNMNAFTNTLIDASPAFFVAVDQDYRVIRMNRTMLEAIGYAESEVLTKDFLVTLVQDSVRPQVKATFDALLRNKGIVTETSGIRTRQGQALEIEWRNTSVTRNGRLDFIIGVGIDVTQRRIIEAELVDHRLHLEKLVQERTSELRLARDAANNANHSKSLFLANMSHEIRTPMNAVLGFAQLLGHDDSLSAESRHKVDTILQSGEHLMSIINDILEMSRIEAGRVEVKSEAVDLHQLLDELALQFRSAAEEKQLAFLAERDPRLPRYVQTDRSKLRQVLANLLGNAVKYTIRGEIAFRSRPLGSGRSVVEVQDTGIGLTPEELGKLFVPFERAQSGLQTAGGTGLGLAISRQYAQLLEGEIVVESRKGVGSLFRFEFSSPRATSNLIPEPSAQNLSLAPDQGEICVLVADDMLSNQELLRNMLEPLGFRVEVARTGREALEMVVSKAPRIVLMDLRMPDMDGREATKKIRETLGNRSPILIGISASAFIEQRRDFIRSGLDGFLAKPFRENELLSLFEKLAGLRFLTAPAFPAAPSSPEIPTWGKMPEAWRTAFKKALAEGNVSHLRSLSHEASSTDSALSVWLLQQVSTYNLSKLSQIEVNHGS